MYMKYIFLSFLVFLLYKSFFSPKKAINDNVQQKVGQQNNDDSEFIDYEEIE